MKPDCVARLIPVLKAVNGAVNVGDEVGGELFYNLALTSWLHLTLDAQVVDSGLPRSETVWVLGVRTQIEL